MGSPSGWGGRRGVNDRTGRRVSSAERPTPVRLLGRCARRPRRRGSRHDEAQARVAHPGGPDPAQPRPDAGGLDPADRARRRPGGHPGQRAVRRDAAARRGAHRVRERVLPARGVPVPPGPASSAPAVAPPGRSRRRTRRGRRCPVGSVDGVVRRPARHRRAAPGGVPAAVRDRDGRVPRARGGRDPAPGRRHAQRLDDPGLRDRPGRRYPGADPRPVPGDRDDQRDGPCAAHGTGLDPEPRDRRMGHPAAAPDGRRTARSGHLAVRSAAAHPAAAEPPAGAAAPERTSATADLLRRPAGR